jgi:hypothetical protein
MTCDEEKPQRKGASNFTLTLSGILGITGLLASGIATYNTIQNDIAGIKRGEQYQEQTNQRLSDEIKSTRAEQRETMREFNEKLDRIIQHWPRGGR